MDQLPGEWTKRCSHCRRELPLTEFNKRKDSRDGKQPWCRDCNAERSRQYYRENRAAHIKVITARNQRIRAENQDRLYDYLRTRACADCGESDPVVLEFDHVRGVKIGNVGHMVRNCVRWETIAAEIAKCEVVCANCHRRRTVSRARSHRSRWPK